MEPGTKIAVISKSAEGVAQVAPSEKTSQKAASSLSPPTEKIETQKQKLETAPVTKKPKSSSPLPPKHAATEPQLPPKERERRVSIFLFSVPKCCSLNVFLLCIRFDVKNKVCLPKLYRTCPIAGSYDETPKTGCYTTERFSKHICNVDNIQ